MLIGRILATLALLCALVVIVLGVWLGDVWSIAVGILGVFSASISTVIVWRARR